MSNLIKCKGWCAPAIINVVVSVISVFILIIYMIYLNNIHTGVRNVDKRINSIVSKFNIFVILNIPLIIVWCWVLYRVCASCDKTTAWLVFIVPLLSQVMTAIVPFDQLAI